MTDIRKILLTALIFLLVQSGIVKEARAAAIAEAITPEIQEMARGLDNDPLKIYNYVHDQIRPVLYFGSKKGAALTLAEKSGNDFDQSALLMSLLRAAGHTNATYEFALQSLPYDGATGGKDIRHWLGLSLPNTNSATTLNMVTNMLFRRGFPVYGTGATTNDFLFHRIWVKLPLGGTNYYLDPGFKVQDQITGISLSASIGLDAGQINTVSGGTVSGNYVQGLNESNLRAQLTSYTTNLLENLRTTNLNKSVAEVLGGASIRPSDSSGLSLSRLFTLGTNNTYYLTNWTDIPTAFMSQLTMDFYGMTNSWFSPALKGQRLSLTFSSTGLGQVWLEDTLVSQTNTTGGDTIPITVTFDSPFGSWNTSLNTLINTTKDDAVSVQKDFQRTNSSYSFIYAFDPSNEFLQQRQSVLDKYRADGLSDTSKEVTLETLNILGLTWTLQYYSLQRIIAKQADVDFMWHSHFTRMAQEQGYGYYVDAYISRIKQIANSGNEASDWDRLAQSAELGAYFGSALEHAIIEQLQAGSTAAASTVKVLQVASAANDKIYLVNSANWLSVSNSLTGYDSSTLGDFSILVSTNQLLLSEKGDRAIGPDWKGYGVVSRFLSSSAFSQGMLISGGYNGGYSGSSSAVIDPVYTYSFSQAQPGKFEPVVPSFHAGDPVNMANGSFDFDSMNLEVGQTEPRGFRFGTSYGNTRRNHNLASMANGWTHNYIMSVQETSATEASLGSSTPMQMAPILVATSAALKYHSTSPTAKNWMVTTLIAKWGIDQMIKNGVSVSLGKESLQFVKQPDGDFTPPAGSTMSLAKVSSAYQLQERNGRTFKFNSTGKLTNIVDVYGKSLNLTYDGNGRVSTITDAFSRSLTLNYSSSAGAQRLTSVTESDGVTSNLRSVGFGYSTTYNAGGDLVTITDPEGKPSTFEYDAMHRITKTKDAYARTIVQNIYDSLGRVSTQYNQGDTAKAWKLLFNGVANVEQDPLGGRKTYFYDERSRLTGMMNALGNRSRSVYDGSDHAVLQISPNGETNRVEFNADNNVTLAIDAMGFAAEMTYDSSKRLKTAKDKRGKVTTYDYNAYHQITKIVGPPVNNSLSNIVEMTFFTSDGAGQVKGALDWKKDQDGYTNAFRYDAFGSLAIQSFHSGDTQKFIANYRGDIITNIDARGKTYLFAYNKRRQLTTSTPPGFVSPSSQTFYDDTGTPWKSVDAMGNETTFTNSVTGKILKTTLPVVGGITNVFLSHYDLRDWLDWKEIQPGERAYNLHDDAGQVIAQSDDLYRTNLYGYNANGARVSETTSLLISPLQTTTFNFNMRGELDSIVDPMTNVTGFAYDQSGNSTNLVNRRGGNFATVYYDDGKVWKALTPNRFVSTLTYNKRGLPETVTGPSTDLTTLSYDNLGRLSSRVDGVGTSAFIYDSNSNIRTNSEGSKSIIRVFDDLNRMTSYNYSDSSDAAGNYTLGFTYDNNGNLKTVTYPDSRTVQYFYDAQNRLVNVLDWAGRSTTYQYDPAKPARLQTVLNANGTRRQFTYDGVGQIEEIKEHRADSVSGGIEKLISYFSFNYDSGGRVTNEFGAPTPAAYTEPSLTMTYDNDNRLASLNGLRVIHDPDGNMTWVPLGSTNLASYGYDSRNRLIGVSQPVAIPSAAFMDTNGVGYPFGAGNNCYGPVNVGLNGDEPISAITAGTPRQDFTGALGFRFQVGSQPLVITELGRWLRFGNTGSHTITLSDESGADIASVTLATAGKPTNEFAYAALATPITLPANTVYFLTTSETVGGDFWLNRDTAITTTSAITITHPAYRVGAGAFSLPTSGSLGYGPVSLRAASVPLVTSVVLSGTLRSDFSGWVGMRLDVGASPLRVSQLGRWIVSGNTGTHNLKIVNSSWANVPNAAATVATSGKPTNQFAYVSLATPVTLSANTTYYLLTQETYGGDKWYDYNGNVSIPGTSAATYSYDPDGNRLKMTQNGQTTRFVVNPHAGLSQVLVRTRSDGTKAFYVYGAGLLYEVDEQENSRTYHYDMRGSTVALTDQRGQVKARYDYSPYGQVIRSSYDLYPNDTPFLFNGQYGVQTDPNGLCFMRARYYNTYIRRFINADPSGMAGGANWYAYADGNPVSMVDPFGLDASSAGSTTWLNSGGTRNTVTMSVPIAAQQLFLPTEYPSMRASTLFEMVSDSMGRGQMSAADIPRARDPNSYSALLIGANHLLGTPVGEQMAGNNAFDIVSSLIPGAFRPKGPSQVLLDSNVIPALKGNPTLGGRLLPGESPVVSFVSGPEMRNAAAHSNGRFFVPKSLDSLDVLNSQPSLNLRINVRGQLPAAPGRFGDGIIGAQAIENKIPLISNDKALRGVVQSMGGTVR